RLPEPGDKQGAVIGYNVVRESVLGEYMLEKEFGKLQGVVSGVAGNEDGLLDVAADNDKDGVKALQFGELNNVVH
ncbi:hypothetical protein C0993_006225, partial [Termitomyces sp. T159_Od127]